MNASYRGHTIKCTKLGWCFVDNENTPYNDLQAATRHIDNLVDKK